MEKAILLYDGECPICNQYKNYVEIRKKYDLLIYNARENPELVNKLRKKGYDINKGMILILGDSIYHREQVLVMMEALTLQKGWYDRIIRIWIKTPWLIRLTYPVLKISRAILLRLLRKNPYI